ncbi:MAG: tetratricopeptide repeat protein [Planctomycetota bacterium]|jgi:Flp pilus assembly protein TadD
MRSGRHHYEILSLLALTALTALIALAALTACEGHGKYTSEFLEEAKGDMSRLHGATQYDLAVQQFNSGDLERALSTINSSIALSGQTAPAELLRGRILLELGRSDDALASLKQGVAIDPAVPEFHYYRAIAFERIGRLEEALEDYRAAAALAPNEAQYILAAAEVLIDLDRLDDARTLLAKQTGDFESNAGVRQALGHVAMLQGDHREAIHFFAEAAMLGPGDPVLREDLCHAQITAGRFTEAEATLRRLCGEEGYEDRRDLSHLHAACLIELDRPVEARSILYRLIRSSDGADDIEGRIKLVDVALMLRDDGLLQTVAKRLMAAAPDRHEGYLAMAMWQRQNGDLEGALRSVERAIDRAGEDPTPDHLREILSRELGRDVG